MSKLTAMTIQHLATECHWSQRAAVIRDIVQVYSGSCGWAVIFCEIKKATELVPNASTRQVAQSLHGAIPQERQHQPTGKGSLCPPLCSPGWPRLPRLSTTQYIPSQTKQFRTLELGQQFEPGKQLSRRKKWNMWTKKPMWPCQLLKFLVQFGAPLVSSCKLPLPLACLSVSLSLSPPLKWDFFYFHLSRMPAVPWFMQKTQAFVSYQMRIFVGWSPGKIDR